MVDQLPQDIMHILLGVIPHELVLMLNNFVTTKKYFTLCTLNSRIESFAYGSQEGKDKPSLIKPQMLSSSIGQTCKRHACTCMQGLCFTYLHLYTFYFAAAQMWALAINLPLMVGDRVPPDDEKWECFLLLLDILQVCTSKVASSSLAGYLEALICAHHQGFVHAASFIPKMHYMVHFVQQILR